MAVVALKDHGGHPAGHRKAHAEKGFAFLAEVAPQDDRTVRAWRRLFIGVYLVFTAGATLVALLSILAVHCGFRTPPKIKGDRISARGDKPEELRSCHKELVELLGELHNKSFALQADVLKYKVEPVAEWRNWSASWRHRWEAVGVRCRLADLAGTGVSAPIDRMEGIHAALAELQLAYTDVAERFIEGYVERMRQLRADLAAVRRMIDSRRHASAGAARRDGAARNPPGDRAAGRDLR